MGKLVGGIVLAFLALVAYTYLFGPPNVDARSVDTGKVADAAGQAGTVVKDAGEPLWLWFIKQPYAYAVLAAIGVTLGINRMWKGMNTTARIVLCVALTVVFMLVAVGLAK
jgi:hypothetical protein